MRRWITRNFLFFFCFIPSPSYLSYYLKLLRIRYPGHGLSRFSMHNAHTSPGYRLIYKLVYPVTRIKPRLRLDLPRPHISFPVQRFFVKREGKYFLFKKVNRNADEKWSAPLSSRDWRIIKGLTFIEMSITGLRLLIGRVSQVTIYLPFFLPTKIAAARTAWNWH